MADLTAASFTTTVERRSIEGKTRRNRVKLVFGDDALTYPAGGVPVPTFSTLGLKSRVDYITIFDEGNATGHVWKYDRDNHKLRCYVQGFTVGAAGAQTLDDFPVSAGDGVTADTHLSLKAGSATVRVGVLKEMATGDAPAAQTLVAECVGW